LLPEGVILIDEMQEFVCSDCDAAAEVQAQISSAAGIVECWLDDVGYTQGGISSCFTDGKPLSHLVADLDSGRCHPSSLILQAVQVGGQFLSLNNRRLWCLKVHQKHRGTAIAVRLDIRASYAQWSDIKRCKRNIDTQNFGAKVRVRGW
jgi:hypothetical protein